jgi:hypothetical protein
LVGLIGLLIAIGHLLGISLGTFRDVTADLRLVQPSGQRFRGTRIDRSDLHRADKKPERRLMEVKRGEAILSPSNQPDYLIAVAKDTGEGSRLKRGLGCWWVPT